MIQKNQFPADVEATEGPVPELPYDRRQHLGDLLELKPMLKRNNKDLLELVKTVNRHISSPEYQGWFSDAMTDL